jgi:hypothetical protein
VSYRREDSAGWVGRLVDDLADRFGADQVFQDVHSITPGVDFLDAINETLRQADCILVVIGPAWLSTKNEMGSRRIDDENDYVRLELATALRRGSRVIPVLVGGARMPARALLPEELSALARRNAAELSDSRWSYDFEQLARAIAGPEQRHLQEKKTGLTSGAATDPTAGQGTDRLASPDDRSAAWQSNTDLPAPSRRSSHFVLAFGLLAVVLVGASALSWWFWSPAPPALGPEPASQSGTPAESAVPTPTAVVVFGVDSTADEALQQVERARRAGFSTARIYWRQGVYRSVVEFPTEGSATEALSRIQTLSPTLSGAYVRKLADWCPNRARNSAGVTECL